MLHISVVATMVIDFLSFEKMGPGSA